MEFQVKKKDFFKSLTILQGVAERRSSIPALSNILIESENNQIVLSTTDLETALVSHVPCTLKQEGKLCVSARKLYQIIRELPDTEISVQRMENHWAEITCGNAVFNLSGLDPMEFPTLPSYSEEDLIAIKSFDLGEMVEKVIFAASTEESRYNLNGIFFEPISSGDKHVARMVATDGHRLALIDRESTEFSGVKNASLVPRRGLNEVKKILSENPGETRISFTENSFVVRVSSFIIIIRLIDGEFPDYTQVIPRENDKVVTLNKQEFSSCLRRISAISTDRVEGIKFTLKKGCIELYSSSQEIGNAMEVFPAVYDGSEVTIGFNARFILEVLNAIDEDEFLLELKDEANAALIKPATGQNPLYVIMPMRV
jgi:DNA polymerase-3 subunit beta